MFEEMSDDRLSEEVRSLAAHIAAGTSRFVLLAAEFDRREGWADWGITSCAHWLNWRCGMALGAAREHLRVGHALASLPTVRQAFEAGTLSYSKVRAITRVATPRNEAVLVEMADYTTAHQLELICRSYRVAAPAEELETARANRADRTVRSFTNARGQVVIVAELPPEEGALVLATLDATASTLFDEQAPEGPPAPDVPAGTPADPPAGAGCAEGDRTFHQRRADALVALAERGWSDVPTDEATERFVVHVHVDDKVLDDPSAPGCCHLIGTGVLPPATAGRLRCDSWVVNLGKGPDGVELEGRTRAIPPRLRRALRLRDGGCRFPGCTLRRWVDAHHVVRVSDNGPTRLDNLVTLCRHHHHLVHEGGYRLALSTSGRVRVWRPDGNEVPPCPSPVPAQGPSLEVQYTDIGATTMPYGGERMQLDCVIDALVRHGPVAGAAR